MRADMRLFGSALVAAFVAWALCAWFGVAGQRKLFYEEWQEEMYDYWMPRMCLEQGYAPAKSADYGIDPAVGGVRGVDSAVGDIVEFSDWYPSADGLRFVTGDMDKVYPALALLPFRFFPATRAGSWWFSGCCGAVFLLSLFLVGASAKANFSFPDSRFSFLISHFSFVLTMPFLFALERGNPIWLSAAAVGVFLVWWDDEVRWKRTAAALSRARTRPRSTAVPPIWHATSQRTSLPPVLPSAARSSLPTPSALHSPSPSWSIPTAPASSVTCV